MKSEDKLDPKKRGLGRGLNALFEDEEDDFSAQASGAESSGSKRLMLGVDQMEPGAYQPRREFDDEALTELSESISKHGVLQPLVVRLKPGFDDFYEIVAGERRWRASQKASLHEVPVIIMELADDQALEIALIENLQREDLNPVEEALGYQQLIEEFGHTQAKAAEVLGKSRSHVANMIRLLTLPPAVQALLRDGKLSAGHARTLVTAENPEELAKMILNQELSVRDAEKLAAQKSGRTPGSKSKKAKDVDTLALEEEMSNALGMNVSIDMRDSHKGALKINFKTLDQLDEILHRLSHFPGRQQTG